jgi:alcohol dehydrogenase
VLVFGGAVPVIGIYAAALARCLGAGRTVYLDSDAVRRQAAEGYGVECVENADALADSSFDIVVDAAGDADKLLSAIRICGPAGQLTSVAPPLVSPEIPLMQSYYKGLSWTIGRPDCRNGHGPALAAWACKGFRPEFLGPKCFDFKDAIDAWLDPALYVAVTRL